MKTVSKFERASAAIAAVAITLSVVWMISGYAYPQGPSSWLEQMAKKAPVQTRS